MKDKPYHYLMRALCLGLLAGCLGGDSEVEETLDVETVTFSIACTTAANPNCKPPEPAKLKASQLGESILFSAGVFEMACDALIIALESGSEDEITESIAGVDEYLMGPLLAKSFTKVFLRRKKRTWKTFTAPVIISRSAGQVGKGHYCVSLLSFWLPVVKKEVQPLVEALHHWNLFSRTRRVMALWTRATTRWALSMPCLSVLAGPEDLARRSSPL